MNYQEYLNSPQWQKTRRAILESGKAKCALCNRKHELDLHHLTYENLGHEKKGDLIILCRRCHRDIHYYKDHKQVSESMLKQSQEITEDMYKEVQAEYGN